MARAQCKVPGCENDVNARQLCGSHYSAMKRGTLKLPDDAPPAPEQDVDTRWQADAACRRVDPELFFPVSERYTEPAVAKARAVCARCPVREECLEWALDALTAGIAGGMTTDERRALRAERKANADRFETVGGPR